MSNERLTSTRWLTYSRFLIFPWVSVDNLGSYLLGHVIKRLADDWQDKFGTELLLVETFAGPEKFDGTVYLAANWTYITAQSTSRTCPRNGLAKTTKSVGKPVGCLKTLS